MSRTGEAADTTEGVSAQEVWDVEPVLRRVVASRIRDPGVVDDLVQDALEHLLAARERLVPDMVVSYGVVTARNLASSHGRTTNRRRALNPRLLDLDSPEQPDEATVRAEERAAIALALTRLPEAERASLVAHEVHGTSVAELVEAGRPVGTMRVRLARSRAKLRLEYVLALRKVELPTAACRPTLLVLAGGDRTRRASGATGRHLLTCGTCAALSEPLVERRRSMALILPFVALHWLLKVPRSHPVQTAAAAGAAVVVAGGVAVAVSATHPVGAVRPAGALRAAGLPPVVPSTPISSHAPLAPSIATPSAPTAPRSGAFPPPSQPSSAPTNASPASPTLVLDGRPLLAPVGSLSAGVGGTVVARGALVQSVVTHNGFWVGTSPAERVWVQLRGPLRPLRVLVGDHVSFVAPLAPLPGGAAMPLGVDAEHGSPQLTAQGAYVSVLTTAITISH